MCNIGNQSILQRSTEMNITFDGKRLVARVGYVLGALLLLGIAFSIFALLRISGDPGAGYAAMALLMISPILLIILMMTLIISIYRGTKKGRGVGKSIFVGCAWGAFYSLIVIIICALHTI